MEVKIFSFHRRRKPEKITGVVSLNKKLNILIQLLQVGGPEYYFLMSQ